MNAYDLINLSSSDEVTNFNALMYNRVGTMISDMERGRIPQVKQIMLLELLNYLLSKDYTCLNKGLRQDLESIFHKLCAIDANYSITPTTENIPDITDRVITLLDGSGTLTTLNGNTLTTL